MRKVINKFFDSYLGCEVKVKQLNVPMYQDSRILETNKWSVRETYYIWSGTNVLILSFCVFKDGSIKIWGGDKLCQTVVRFFSIDSVVAMKYIRDWFADKHNLNKINDLLKFIPTPS